MNNIWFHPNNCSIKYRSVFCRKPDKTLAVTPFLSIKIKHMEIKLVILISKLLPSVTILKEYV